MDKAIVRAILNAAGNDPVRVTLDNEHFFTTHLNGCRLDFNDDKEVLTVIMSNDDPNTMMECPYSLFVTEYEHIQTMTIRARVKNVVNAIDTAGFIKDTEAMKKFVASGSIGETYGFTPSTEDVSNRQGAKPNVYRTDEYGSAGENRSERTNKLIPRGSIKVGADGKIQEDPQNPVPKINRDVDRTTNSEAFTPEGFTAKTK